MKRYHKTNLGDLPFILDVRHSKFFNPSMTIRESVDELNINSDISDHFSKINAESHAVGSFIANALLDMVNGGIGEDAFIEAILKGHRTLQQSVFRLICKLIKAWAKSPFDLRNKATVEICQRITREGINDAVPFI